VQSVPASYRLASALLRPLPPGCGQHLIAGALLSRRPLPRGTLAERRLRGGAAVRLDLGVAQEARTWILGRYEPATLAFLARTLPPGGVFFDVGAHIGLISLALARARRDAQVHCFEPDPATVARLKENLRAPEDKRVTVVHTGVGEAHGVARLVGGGSMLAHVVAGGGGVEIPMLRLDDYVVEQDLRRVDLIKLDAEGHELQVLRGSEGLIRRFHPTIVCEARGHGDDDGVSTLLQEAGYRRRPIPAVGVQRLRGGAAGDGNVAFVPV
jgi:FkbM family methyltransferase